MDCTSNVNKIIKMKKVMIKITIIKIIMTLKVISTATAIIT